MPESMNSPEQESPQAEVQHLSGPELKVLRGDIDRTIAEQAGVLKDLPVTERVLGASGVVAPGSRVEVKQEDIDRTIAEQAGVLKDLPVVERVLGASGVAASSPRLEVKQQDIDRTIAEQAGVLKDVEKNEEDK